MAKVRQLKVEVTQNSLLKTVSDVPQWEAQVLLAVWGEDARIIGEEVVERNIPDAGDEFARLAFKYGPKDDDNPFVARVYGNFGPGIRSLAREFEAAQSNLSEDFPVDGFDLGAATTARQEAEADEYRENKAAAQAAEAAATGASVETPVPENPALANAAAAAADADTGEDATVDAGPDATQDVSALLPPGTTVDDLPEAEGEDGADAGIADLVGAGEGGAAA